MRDSYTLDNLPFTNSYTELPEQFRQFVNPQPLQSLHLIDFNQDVADLIQLDPGVAHQPDFCDFFNGRQTLKGSRPVAMCYSGHQFGVYVPRLGDGRAILLGQVRLADGGLWDLQVKGGGPTLYSRQGDGRAVLRSTIREYLCSEAMAGLGIPTTRALCLMGSEQIVYREQPEPAALLVRLAESHIRFGSFEYFFYMDQHESLQTLADYVLNHYFPSLLEDKNPCLALLNEVIQRTAELIASWVGVGFAHGVMNSDNMSILGLTLDYGPFGFVDTYQESFICNHTDTQGRYAFGRQPEVGLFNLTCLAQALLPLLSKDKDEAITLARASLEHYWTHFRRYYQVIIAAKLGLDATQEEAYPLFRELLKLMEGQVDYSYLFRTLCEYKTSEGADNRVIAELFSDQAAFTAWSDRYRRCLILSGSQDEQRSQSMRTVNPKYILRNYLAEQAIRKAEDECDYSEISLLIKILKSPYDDQLEYEDYAQRPPEWANSIQVSCSS